MKQNRHGQPADDHLCVGSKIKAQILAREGHEILVTLYGGISAVIRFEDLKDPSWWSSLLICKKPMDVIKVKIIRIADNNIYVVPTDFCAGIMSQTTQVAITLLEDEVSTVNSIKGKEEKISRLEKQMSSASPNDKSRFSRKIVKLREQISFLKTSLRAIQHEKKLYSAYSQL